MDDILPPVPPGEQRKEGFFKKLFGTKKEKQAPEPVIISQGGLQQIAEQIPSRLETMKVSENVDLDKLRSQLGLTSVLAQQAPPPVKQEPTALQDKLEVLKPRYSPDKMPELPDFSTDVKDYKSIDFTKELPEAPSPPPSVYQAPKVPPTPIVRRTPVDEPKKSPVDWTQDRPPLKAQFQQQPIESPRPILKEPESKNVKKQPLKSLEPDALESFSKAPKSGKSLDWAEPASELEREVQALKPSEKVDFTQDPVPLPKVKEEELSFIAEPTKILQKKEQKPQAPKEQLIIDEPPMIKREEPVIVKRAPTLEEIEKATAQSILDVAPEPMSALKSDTDILAQPVEKFAAELRDKLRKEVQEEERKKLMSGIEDERSRLDKEREEFELEKKELDNKLKEIEERENRLIKKIEDASRLKDEIKEEKERIKKEREEHKTLKEKIPKLKKQHQELENKINSLKGKIDLNQRIEENLTLREKALKDAQEKLENMETGIREKGFSNFLEDELTQKDIAYPEYQPPEDRDKQSHAELYQAVDDCRSLIWQKKLPEARDVYMKAREMYHNLLAEGIQSEEIYMLIRELYDDLNLAILQE